LLKNLGFYALTCDSTSQISHPSILHVKDTFSALGAFRKIAEQLGSGNLRHIRSSPRRGQGPRPPLTGRSV